MTKLIELNFIRQDQSILKRRIAPEKLRLASLAKWRIIYDLDGVEISS